MVCLATSLSRHWGGIWKRKKFCFKLFTQCASYKLYCIDLNFFNRPFSIKSMPSSYRTKANSSTIGSLDVIEKDVHRVAVISVDRLIIKIADYKSNSN